MAAFRGLSLLFRAGFDVAVAFVDVGPGEDAAKAGFDFCASPSRTLMFAVFPLTALVTLSLRSVCRWDSWPELVMDVSGMPVFLGGGGSCESVEG